MDQLTRNIFFQDFGKHETKMDDSASKKISHAKIQACTTKNIEFLDNFNYKFIYGFAFCLTYDFTDTDIEVYPVPLHFFIRTSKVLMILSVLFVKIFSLKVS